MVHPKKKTKKILTNTCKCLFVILPFFPLSAGTGSREGKAGLILTRWEGKIHTEVMKTGTRMCFHWASPTLSEPLPQTPRPICTETTAGLFESVLASVAESWYVISNHSCCSACGGLRGPRVCSSLRWRGRGLLTRVGIDFLRLHLTDAAVHTSCCLPEIICPRAFSVALQQYFLV